MYAAILHRWEGISKVQPLLITAIVSAGVAAFASIAERRRNARADLDRVGFMPWTFILVMAVLVFAVSAAFALRGY